MAYSILTIRSVTVSDNSIYVCEAQDDGISRRIDHTVQINGIIQLYRAIIWVFIIVWHMYIYSSK